MIKTTYFANVKKLDKGLNFVSIARKTPEGFPGKVCMKLAPSASLLWSHKNNPDVEAYTKEFNLQLEKLNAKQIVNEIGEDAVLVCYEGKDKFCHRHLVSDWLRREGFDVIEI